MPIVKLSRKGQIVIPKEIRENLGIKAGTRLTATLKQGEIILTPPEKYAKQTRGLLKGTWGRTKEQIEDYLAKERDNWR